MAQGMKSMFTGPMASFAPFAWPQAGTAMSSMGEWFKIQQELVAMTAKFGQEATQLLSSDVELASDVMRRLMVAKTPEELAATQRDMFELVSSKYFEQWLKLGEEMKALFAKAGVPTPEGTAPAAETAFKQKKAA